MRLVEALIFLPMAAGAHVALWAIAPVTSGASATGGPGQARVTLAAAAPQQAALAQAWQTPAAATTTAQQPRPATARTDLPKPTALQTGPTLPPVPTLRAVLPAALPQIEPPRPQAYPVPSPDTPTQPKATTAPQPALPLPRADDAPLRQPVLRPSITAPDTPARADTSRPVPPLPDKLPEPRTSKATRAKPSSAAAPSQRAAGGGAAKTRKNGQTGQDATQSANAATRNALQARWGAKIQRKVHRRLIYPRGATGTGSARVALTINRGGQLTGLRLIRSSGVAAFDAAALNAVRRAGHFPKAPKDLTKPSYSFTLSLSFNP